MEEWQMEELRKVGKKLDLIVSFAEVKGTSIFTRLRYKLEHKLRRVIKRLL